MVEGGKEWAWRIFLFWPVTKYWLHPRKSRPRKSHDALSLGEFVWARHSLAVLPGHTFWLFCPSVLCGLLLMGLGTSFQACHLCHWLSSSFPGYGAQSSTEDMRGTFPWLWLLTTSPGWEDPSLASHDGQGHPGGKTPSQSLTLCRRSPMS